MVNRVKCFQVLNQREADALYMLMQRGSNIKVMCWRFSLFLEG